MVLINFVIMFWVTGLILNKATARFRKYIFWANILDKFYWIGVRIHEIIHYLAICCCGLVTARTHIVIKKDGSGGFVSANFRKDPSFLQALFIGSAPITWGTLLLMGCFQILHRIRGDGDSPWYIVALYWGLIFSIFMVINPSDMDWVPPRIYFQQQVGNSIRQCIEVGMAIVIFMARWSLFRQYILIPDPWFEIFVLGGILLSFECGWMILVKLANRPHRAPFTVKPTSVLIAPNDPILANFEKIPMASRFETPHDKKTRSNSPAITEVGDADKVDRLAAECMQEEFPDFDASQEESDP